jgi:hypothetical protein
VKGLVIRQPWIGMILRGEKIWEMRGQPWRYRGPIALIEKGSGTVVGLARLVDDGPPLTETELRATFDKHRIPASELPIALREGWVRPWVLADVTRLSRRVPYKHTSGGSRVNLSSEEEAAVLSAASWTATRTSHARVPARSEDLAPPYRVALSKMPAEERARAMHELPHIGGKSVRSITDADIAERAAPAKSASSKGIEPGERSLARQVVSQISDEAGLAIPTNAAMSIRRRGRKFYIDVEWDDHEPARRKRPRSWVKGVGTLAALVCMFSQAAFVIHIFLGMISSNISVLSAFQWTIPVIIGTITAELLGQGHMLRGEPQMR